jgi:pentatricopeptide repeat protein
MFEVHESGNSNVQPNTIAFTSVCDAWSKEHVDHATDKVQSLINWMNEISNSGYTDVRPNEYTYNCLLNAIVKSKDPSKADKALHILRFMQSDPTLSPSIFNYNSVLRVCSFTHGTASERFNAIKVAVMVMEEIMQQGNSDRLNITFGIFFNACANLTLNDEEKVKLERMVEAVFKKCCEFGQVDDKLILQVRKACSQQLYLKLFGEFKGFPRVHITDVPQSWRSNIVHRKHR